MQRRTLCWFLVFLLFLQLLFLQLFHIQFVSNRNILVSTSLQHLQNTTTTTTKNTAVPFWYENQNWSEQRAKALEKRTDAWNFINQHDSIVKEYHISPNNGVQCNLPLLLFVGGRPNQGKSTISNALSKLSTLSLQFVILRVDETLVTYCNTLGYQASIAHVGRGYKQLKKNKIHLQGFYQHLATLIRKESAFHDIILVDWALFTLDDQTALHQAIDPEMDFLSFQIKRGAVHHKGRVVVDAAVRKPPVENLGFTENKRDWVVASTSLTAHNTMTYIQHLYAEHIRHVPQHITRQQCYKEAGVKCHHSNDNINQHLESLKLPKTLVAGTRILNIGSSVEFTNQLVKQFQPKYVHSIESVTSSPIETKYARCYNSMIMGVHTIFSNNTTIFKLLSTSLDNTDDLYHVIICLQEKFSSFSKIEQEVLFTNSKKYLFKEESLLIVEMNITNTTTNTSKHLLNLERVQILASDYFLVFWGPTTTPTVGQNYYNIVFHFSIVPPKGGAIKFPDYKDLKLQESQQQ